MDASGDASGGLDATHELRHLAVDQSFVMKGADEFAADDLLDAESIVLPKVKAPRRVRTTEDDDGLGQPPASLLDDLDELEGHSFSKAPRSISIRLPARKLTGHMMNVNPR